MPEIVYANIAVTIAILWPALAISRGNGRCWNVERKIKRIQPARRTAPKNKRVAAYARASSVREAPLHSLSAQISHYSELIQKTPGWEYAGVCAAAAPSGTKDSR